VLADGWDYFVVQILDELRDFFLDFFGGFCDRFADACRRVFYLAVEVVDSTPCVCWA
jgi:hypothetical protein